MLNKLIGFFSAAALALVLVTSVDAAVLKNAWLQMSDARSGQSGVTHTFRFFVPTSNLNSMRFQYCTTASGVCTTPVMTTQNIATDGILTRATVDVSGDWDTVDNDTNGTLELSETGGDGSGNGAANYEVAFGTITNPDFTSDCTLAAGGSTETCYVRIGAYSATGFAGTPDSAVVSLTITQTVTVSATVDPSFSVIIAPVTDQVGTATVNGTTLTTTIDPSATTLPFGNLQPATPKYLAHYATVTTNATNGYSITVRMSGNMTGSAYGDDIDPFSGNAATYQSSQSWTTPTGNTSGTNTGWLGVGTDDNAVTGWSAANTFFSLSGDNATQVAAHATSVSAEVDMFVYGIEVNAYQEADSYTANMRYNALPVY